VRSDALAALIARAIEATAASPDWSGHLRLVPGSRISVKGGDAPKSDATKDVS